MEKEGIRVSELPFPDEKAPSRQDTAQFLKFMDDQERKGSKVLVHCKQGLGRAPTMGMIYLLHKGVPLEDIPAEEIPTTRVQREYIKDFAREKQLHNKMGASAGELDQAMSKTLAPKKTTGKAKNQITLIA